MGLAVLRKGMRFVVVKPDGRFVVMRKIAGCKPATTYVMSILDSQDAHDFGNREAAVRWAKEHGCRVVELTDSGHWPPDE